MFLGPNCLHRQSADDISTVKPVISSHSTRTQKLVFNTDYRLMHVKSIAESSPSSILQYFRPSLSYQTFVLSIFKWLIKTGFTVD